MRRRTIRRLPPPIALVVFLAGPGLVEADEPQKGAPRTPTGFEEKCPRCGFRGRITCPTCGGSGSLRKPCPVCAGKGRKPCPQCTGQAGVPGRPAASPGKLPCPACGGKDTIEGSQGRPCFKCEGAKELPCLVCLSRGDLSCPKTRFDRTCPTCRFVGTVACPECKGEGRMTAPILARESGEAPEVEEAASTSGETARVDRPPRPPSYTEGQYLADSEATETAWRLFEEDYLEVRRFFARDLGKEIRRLRSDLGRLHRAAAESAEDEVSGGPALVRRIRESQRTIEGHAALWERLFDGSERVDKLHRRILPLRESQVRWSLDLPRGDLEAIQERLALLKETLALGRKAAAALKSQLPPSFERQVKDAALGVDQLRAEAEKLKGLAAPGKPARPRGATGEGDAGRSAGEVRGSAVSAGPPERRDPPEPSGGEPAAGGGGGAPGGRAVGAEGKRSDAAGGSSAALLLVGIIGAAACVLGYARLRRREVGDSA